MKKRMFALLLAALTLCLCACGKSDAERLAEVAGRWVTIVPLEQSRLEGFYSRMDLSPEEIALCSGLEASYPYFIEYKDDVTYRQGADVAGARESLAQFVRDIFDTLYASRTALNDLYGVDFGPCTQEEFQMFYAELYGLQSYDALIQALADTTLDFNAMALSIEHGKFRFSAEKIYFKPNFETEEVYTVYEILEDGRMSILVEGNEKEIYTKVN